VEARLREQVNLSAEAQTTRLRVGIAALGVALGLAVLMIEAGLSPVYRALLIVPFAIATNGVTAGLFKTSGVLAARGFRDLGSGKETITSRRELATIRRRGRRVLLIAAASAILLTALVVVVR
jgi:hypothetical protein